MKNIIQCKEHGSQFKAFLCTHLRGEHKHPVFFNLGVFPSASAPSVAWCSYCEDLRKNSDATPSFLEVMFWLKEVCQECFNAERKTRRKRNVIIHSGFPESRSVKFRLIA